MEKFKSWVKGNNLWDDNTIIYAIARDNAQITPPEKCRYDVGMVVTSNFPSNDVLLGSIEKGKYLIIQTEHTAQAVGNLWANIFNILTEQNFNYDDSKPILERYKNDIIKKGYCEFCVPII